MKSFSILAFVFLFVSNLAWADSIIAIKEACELWSMQAQERLAFVFAGGDCIFNNVPKTIYASDGRTVKRVIPTCGSLKDSILGAEKKCKTLRELSQVTSCRLMSGDQKAVDCFNAAVPPPVASNVPKPAAPAPDHEVALPVDR